jgi:predicted double-glycine peptidase
MQSKRATGFLISLLVFCGHLVANEVREKPHTYFRTPDRQVQVPVRSFLAIRNANIVMQQEDYSCGAATLATVIRYFWGDDVTEDKFLEATKKLLTATEMQDRVKNGLTMTDLRRTAVATGYPAVMGRRTLEQLKAVKVPVILRIKHDGHEHFVVWKGILGEWVYLADPIRGNVRTPLKQFQKEWTDDVILVVVKRGADPPKEHALVVVPPTREDPELQPVRRLLTGGR